MTDTKEHKVNLKSVFSPFTRKSQSGVTHTYYKQEYVGTPNKNKNRHDKRREVALERSPIRTPYMLTRQYQMMKDAIIARVKRQQEAAHQRAIQRKNEKI